MDGAVKSTEYRDLPGWIGYRVGDDGSIWSCRTSLRFSSATNWRRMRPKLDRYGYRTVTLRGDGIKKSQTVHQLVLFAFVGPKPEGHQCRHLDGNRSNNAITNLEWGTPRENCADRDQHGHTQRGRTHYRAKLTEQDVVAIRNSPMTNRELAIVYSVSDVMISFVKRRRFWKHVP